MTYSGGTAEWVGPLGGHYSFSYTLSGGYWGGSATTSDFYPPNLWVVGDPGWTHCHDTITATFTWNNDGDPSDIAPDTAVLKQDCSASWGGDYGSCSNGLGDPEVDGYYTGSSTGTHYRIVSNPGNTFVVTVTPDAASVAVVDGPAPEIGAGSGVSYQAVLTPVVLVVSGVTKANGLKNALIGQHLIGALTCAGYELRHGTFQYSVTGSYYKSVDWGAPPGDPAHRHVYIPEDPSDYYSDSIGLFFWQDGVQTFTGSADCYINNVYLGRVSAHTDVKVYLPYYYYGHSVETPTSHISITFPHGSPVYTVLSSSTDGKHPAIYFEGRVGTPDLFRGPQGTNYGEWCFTQTVDSHRHGKLNGSQIYGWDTPGFVLDTSYPYGFENDALNPPWWYWDWASSEIHSGPTNWTSDSPGNGLVGDSFDVEDSFRMFENYVPPDSGLGSEDVATSRKDWTWTWTAANGVGGWELSPGPHVAYVGEYEEPSDTYQWTDNVCTWTGNPTEYYWASGGVGQTANGGGSGGTGGTGGTGGIGGGPGRPDFIRARGGVK